MNDEYRNDVEPLYNNILRKEKVLFYLFVFVLILTVINSFNDSKLVVYLLILSNVIYVVLSFYVDLILKNDAENERRKTMISNAFDVNITSNKTKNYYNNKLAPSIKKLGVDSFESTLFTRENLCYMIKINGIKMLFIVIMWIIIIFNIGEENTLLTLVQGMFSAEILLNYFKMVYYYARVKKIYDGFYILFVTKKYNQDKDLPILIDYVIEYESVKSYCHIMLSSNFFNKTNNILSEKWNEIQNNIK